MIERGTRMKKLSLFGFIVFLTMLIGCGNSKGSNYVNNYGDYLDYSLGDWKVVSENQGKSGGFGGAFSKKFNSWEIEYSSSDNKKRVLYLDNFTGTSNNEKTFGSWINKHAEDIVDSGLENEILRKYFKEEEIGTDYRQNSSQTSTFFLLDNAIGPVKKEEYFKQIIKPGSGIKLNELTAKNLFENNPDYIIRFVIYTNITEEKSREVLQNTRDLVIKDLVKYCGNNGIIIAEINWEKVPRKDTYSDDVRYFVHGKEIPDDIEKRHELNRSPIGYIKEVVIPNLQK
jgi:hypothetical protein